MGFSATVTQTPALARLGDPATAGRGYVRDAQRAVGAALVADLATRSSDHPTIASAWAFDVRDAGSVIALLITNSSPGAPFLNAGATWPGKMPNIGAIGDYLERKGGTRKGAWIAARMLQLKGMPAHHWTRDALAAQRPALLQINAAAIRRFLKGLG